MRSPRAMIQTEVLQVRKSQLPMSQTVLAVVMFTRRAAGSVALLLVALTGSCHGARDQKPVEPPASCRAADFYPDPRSSCIVASLPGDEFELPGQLMAFLVAHGIPADCNGSRSTSITVDASNAWRASELLREYVRSLPAQKAQRIDLETIVESRAALSR